MTMQEIDAQISQLKTRRAALLAADRRPLDEWIAADEHGLPRRSLSLDACRRYAVINGTKLKTILEAAERAEVPIVEGETE
jgi:hypothetical protein